MKFIKDHIEQILDILIIFGILFLIIMCTACSRVNNEEQNVEQCKLLYKGKYDILLIDSGKTYVFIPSTNSTDNSEIKLYKRKFNDIDTISDLNQN